MKLLAKFSLIFIVAFGLGLTLAGIICYSLLQNDAREQVLDQAHLMMDAAKATRSYTTHQIKPLLESKADDDVFHPQTVPAFAATEIFESLRKTYPEYTYKEATLNPTNPRDRAVDWEADIIQNFREHPDTADASFSGERSTPMGTSLYFAKPLRAAKGCLQCHSTPEAAPASMIKLYGSANGFGWKENEVVGAQIVSVPMALPQEMASHSFRQLMISLITVGAITLLVLNVLLTVAVIRPARRFAESSDRISKGEMAVPELPVRGKDEISMMATAFNRMHRSLVQAMKMLDKD
jgi:protein-histidine pros-kinase